MEGLIEARVYLKSCECQGANLDFICRECRAIGDPDRRRRSSTYCKRTLGAKGHVARSRARAWPEKWGLSLNPWGRTAHVSWEDCRVSGSVHVKAKRNWQSGCKGIVKKGIFEVYDSKVSRTARDVGK